MNRANQPAFARPYSLDTYGDFAREVPAQAGMTIREHFAGLAMQGIIASAPECGEVEPRSCARLAIECADALIAELEAKP